MDYRLLAVFCFLSSPVVLSQETSIWSITRSQVPLKTLTSSRFFGVSGTCACMYWRLSFFWAENILLFLQLEFSHNKLSQCLWPSYECNLVFWESTTNKTMIPWSPNHLKAKLADTDSIKSIFTEAVMLLKPVEVSQKRSSTLQKKNI